MPSSARHGLRVAAIWVAWLAGVAPLATYLPTVAGEYVVVLVLLAYFALPFVATALLE